MKKHLRALNGNPCFFAGLLLLAMLPLAAGAAHLPPAREYYEIRIYHLENAGQEARLDAYLQQAMLPALHRAGIAKVGVFKPVGNDTATHRRLYLLLAGSSVAQLLQLPQRLAADAAYNSAGKDFIEAAWDAPAYTRMETVLLEAFSGQPRMQQPALRGPKSERVYELRSYESASEKLHLNKVEMFNKGDEVGIFKRLGFNAVFYGSVVSGSRMPNLMYMTTFENKADRDEHWKAFGSDPAWKSLSAKPEYQHNVSRSEILFLRPTEYSDI